MKKLFLSGFLGMALAASAGARTWTDKKGRKIEAEYVSQTKDAVLLKLKNGKEVSVPFANLSRADLSYLIEAEIAAAEKNKSKKPADGEMENKGDDGAGGAGFVVEAADPAWDRPIPTEVTLKEPLAIKEEKHGEFMHYSSANFRLVADSRVSAKTVEALLEAGELTLLFCSEVPFGLEHRYPRIDGKYEIHTIAEADDWVKAGHPRDSWAGVHGTKGYPFFCFEINEMRTSGRARESKIRQIAEYVIYYVSRAMIPQTYQKEFGDWFYVGFPRLLQMAQIEEGKMDLGQMVVDIRDRMVGRKPGRELIFDKTVELPPMPKLLEMQEAGMPDDAARRKLTARLLVMVGYLVFLDEEGKATGFKEGLRYIHDFEKNMPKRITYRTQVELEQKKAELLKKRKEIGETATALVFRKRPWDEVQADLIKLWAANKLPVVFEKN